VAGKAISGARARRNIRIAQMAGLALGVSAAALWAMKVPMVEDPLPEKPTLAGDAAPDVKPAAGDAPAQPLDRESVEGTAERMSVAGRIKPAGPVPGPDGDKPVTPAAPTGDVKYIGSIREPSRMLALVSRGDGKKQKLLAVGREWEGVKLLDVTEDEIQIEDASGVKTIARSERKGPAVEWTKMASNAPAATATTPAGMQAGMINAAGARGVSASQAEQMRAALAERSRNRRGQPVTLTPQMLRELGLSEKEAATMGEDQLMELRDKYQRVIEERGGAKPGAEGDGAPGEHN
jgi:hypothetical protein